jgi:phage shock protein PspC (stress-responsive transcriptional regulator)
MSATNDTTALPLRTHTLLGVCEAVGEDFGFNPLYLRVPLSMIVLYSPMIAIGAYLALGLIVLASRLLFPNAKTAEAPAVAAPVADNNSDEVKLAA